MNNIILSGDIDVYTVDAAARKLADISGPTVIDISRVSLLTAAGLTALWHVARRVGVGIVTLLGARAHIEHVLRLVKFDELFILA